MVSTQGSLLLRDNICSIFGHSFLSSLTAVHLDIDTHTDTHTDTVTGIKVEVQHQESLSRAHTLTPTLSLSLTSEHKEEKEREGEMEVVVERDRSAEELMGEARVDVKGMEGKEGVGTGVGVGVGVGVCRIEGFVSRAGAGVGRSDNDRQYLYVNHRPVDMPRVNKTINEVRVAFSSLLFTSLHFTFLQLLRGSLPLSRVVLWCGVFICMYPCI